MIEVTNELRQQVWEIDAEIHGLMQIPEQYRSNSKISELQSKKAEIEQKIAQLRNTQ